MKNRVLKKHGAHLCPVCHKHMFEGRATFAICPECGWEDDGSSENGPSDTAATRYLEVYRKRYEELIAAHPGYRYKRDGIPGERDR